MRRCTLSMVGSAVFAAGLGCAAPPSAAEACPTWRPFDPVLDGDYAAYAARSARPRCPKPWTVLIYMAADVADLPDHATADLREMEEALASGGVAAASSARADVVVQLDLPGPPGLRRYHLFSRTGDAPAAVPSSPELQVVPEGDGPPAQALADFVDWGRAQYPSDRLMVVLWGHGQGWRPRSTDERVHYIEGGFAGGFGFDDSQSAVIDVPALADALQGGPDEALIDVLVTDACLMQSVDVVGALSRTARYLVGHEQIDPYMGFPYDRVIPLVADGRSLPPHPACPTADEACRVAAGLPGLLDAPETTTDDTYVASATAGPAVSAELLPALDRLSSALIVFLAEDPLRAADVKARLGSRTPGEGVPGFAGNTVDLGVLLARLRQEAQGEQVRCDPPCPAVTALLSVIADTERALDNAVIAVGVGRAYADDEAYARTSGPSGLSVWLPPRADVFAARRDSFASSPASGWLLWLDHLHAPS